MSADIILSSIALECLDCIEVDSVAQEEARKLAITDASVAVNFLISKTEIHQRPDHLLAIVILLSSGAKKIVESGTGGLDLANTSLLRGLAFLLLATLTLESKKLFAGTLRSVVDSTSSILRFRIWLGKRPDATVLSEILIYLGRAIIIGASSLDELENLSETFWSLWTYFLVDRSQSDSSGDPGRVFAARLLSKMARERLMTDSQDSEKFLLGMVHGMKKLNYTRFIKDYAQHCSGELLMHILLGLLSCDNQAVKDCEFVESMTKQILERTDRSSKSDWSFFSRIIIEWTGKLNFVHNMIKTFSNILKLSLRYHVSSSGTLVTEQLKKLISIYGIANELSGLKTQWIKWLELAVIIFRKTPTKAVDISNLKQLYEIIESAACEEQMDQQRSEKVFYEFLGINLVYHSMETPPKYANLNSATLAELRKSAILEFDPRKILEVCKENVTNKKVSVLGEIDHYFEVIGALWGCFGASIMFDEFVKLDLAGTALNASFYAKSGMWAIEGLLHNSRGQLELSYYINHIIPLLTRIDQLSSENEQVVQLLGSVKSQLKQTLEIFLTFPVDIREHLEFLFSSLDSITIEDNEDLGKLSRSLTQLLKSMTVMEYDSQLAMKKIIGWSITISEKGVSQNLFNSTIALCNSEFVYDLVGHLLTKWLTNVNDPEKSTCYISLLITTLETHGCQDQRLLKRMLPYLQPLSRLIPLSSVYVNIQRLNIRLYQRIVDMLYFHDDFVFQNPPTPLEITLQMFETVELQPRGANLKYLMRLMESISRYLTTTTQEQPENILTFIKDYALLHSGYKRIDSNGTTRHSSSQIGILSARNILKLLGTTQGTQFLLTHLLAGLLGYEVGKLGALGFLKVIQDILSAQDIPLEINSRKKLEEIREWGSKLMLSEQHSENSTCKTKKSYQSRLTTNQSRLATNKSRATKRTNFTHKMLKKKKA